MSAVPGTARTTRAASGVAIAASAALVLSSPLVGEVRAALLRVAPGYYVPVLQGLVGLDAAALVIVCLTRIRRHRRLRYAALGLSLALGVGAAAALGSGDRNVDAVEAFHFVEYSALTLLFFWAVRGRPRWEAYGRAALAGVAVGVVDEWFQWFVPGRAGEVHDVLVDAVAVACGVLLCVAIDGWEPPPVARRPGAARAFGVRAAAVALLLAAFVATVHLGHEIRDDENGQVSVFRSRFSAADLRQLGARRGTAWAGAAPPVVGRYGREDQYLAEALWHVRRRNQGMDRDRHGEPHELDVAWRENQILERYFAPALEAPAVAGTTGHQLAPEQLVLLDATRAHGTEVFVSDAEAFPILAWSPAAFWAAALAASAVLALSGWAMERWLATPRTDR
ncbi:MAG TPA: VanZ family protein [Planctomycetota bacterium]|nr:VanZ family protein [Planctomycetota bacterium]